MLMAHLEIDSSNQLSAALPAGIDPARSVSEAGCIGAVLIVARREPKHAGGNGNTDPVEHVIQFNPKLKVHPFPEPEDPA